MSQIWYGPSIWAKALSHLLIKFAREPSSTAQSWRIKIKKPLWSMATLRMRDGTFYLLSIAFKIYICHICAAYLLNTPRKQLEFQVLGKQLYSFRLFPSALDKSRQKSMQIRMALMWIRAGGDFMSKSLALSEICWQEDNARRVSGRNYKRICSRSSLFALRGQDSFDMRDM